MRGGEVKIRAVDLFAGAGGASTGLVLAAEAVGVQVDLTAVNHWPAAVHTHATNYPKAKHLCQSVESVDPREVVPGGHLHLLVAGPECTFFSAARGGKPIDDQRRASPWQIQRWCELLRVDHVLVENVPEFESWGPLNAKGRPIPSKKGTVYRAWVSALEAMGYTVEARVLCAADFGEATTRRRLFVQAVRGRRPILWPEPTHSPTGASTLLRGTQRWRPAREVIDWSHKGRSIFQRKKPLSPNTLRRIAEGLKRFGGGAFVLSQQSGGAPRSVNDPLPTLATDGVVGLVQPFLVPMYGERRNQAPRTHSIEDPVPTIPASGGGKFGLVEPFLLNLSHGQRVHAIDEPLPTITTAKGGELAVVQPFTMPYCSNGGRLARPVSEPLATITTRDRIALVQPDGGDILFRMLSPRELAAAMGFPEDYQFIGNKSETIAMIGNAWSVRKAKALCEVVLSRWAKGQSTKKRRIA